MKTSKSSGKSSRVEITPEIQSIIDKHSGDEKYVFDILNKDMDEDQVRRKIKSKTSTINENLKKLARRAGIDQHISASVARYSVNHYLTTKGYATREQQSEMMVNSPKVNKGYFDGLDEKFKIQRKLGNILEDFNRDPTLSIYDKILPTFEQANEMLKDLKKEDYPIDVKKKALKASQNLLDFYNNHEKDFLDVESKKKLIDIMKKGKAKQLEDRFKNKKDDHI